MAAPSVQDQGFEYNRRKKEEEDYYKQELASGRKPSEVIAELDAMRDRREADEREERRQKLEVKERREAEVPAGIHRVKRGASEETYQPDEVPGKSVLKAIHKESDTTFDAIKRLARTLKKEITDYPKSKIDNLVEDIRTGREYEKLYRQGRRTQKIEKAIERGKKAEVELYELEKENRLSKFERDQARKDIQVDASRAFVVSRERAKGTITGKQEMAQVTVNPMAISVQPRKRQKDMFDVMAESSMAPILSLGVIEQDWMRQLNSVKPKVQPVAPVVREEAVRPVTVKREQGFSDEGRQRFIRDYLGGGGQPVQETTVPVAGRPTRGVFDVDFSGFQGGNLLSLNVAPSHKGAKLSKKRHVKEKLPDWIKYPSTGYPPRYATLI